MCAIDWLTNWLMQSSINVDACDASDSPGLFGLCVKLICGVLAHASDNAENDDHLETGTHPCKQKGKPKSEQKSESSWILDVSCTNAHKHAVPS